MTVAAPEAAAPRAIARRVAGRPHLVPLLAIVTLSAFLDFWNLGQNGYANTYYAGAVRSMLRSWSNFFFVSFDPGGLVSVDKPPLALWLQAGSAKLFGYSGVALLAPEALAGVCAVLLLYALVARYFGRVAGLLAALALAVSPVSVSVNRDNNPDALFAFLLVVAAYLGARAAESGRLRWLVAAAVAVGLAFETKMLAAGVVVPALAAAYLFFAPRPWRIRLAHLAAAGAVLAVVSGAWIAAVDLTPPGDRPYVGSTSDNSALSLALDYNGLGRVIGQSGGTSFGGGLGGAFSGSPGFLRLLNSALGDQAAWLLPPALAGLAGSVWLAARARDRRRLAALVVVGGWFLAAGAVFSYASGIVHTYYLSAMAPATAGLAGLGSVALWRIARRGRLWLVPAFAALALTAWLEVDLLRRSAYLAWLQTLVIVGAAAAGVALVAAWRRPAMRAAALCAAVVAFLAAPAAWAESTLEAPVNGVFPGAGPSFVSGLSADGFRGGFFGRGGFGGGPPRFGGGNGGPPQGFGFRNGGPPPGGRFRGGFGGFDGGASLDEALAYARSHAGTKRFTLVVSSETSAADAVIRGESVAAMGGFTGRETVLTPSLLSRLVRDHEARYFLIGSVGFGPFGNSAESLIQAACTQVAAVPGLYDCSGRAAQLAR